MRICHNAPKIQIGPGFCLALAFVVFLIPIEWVAAWMLAVTFHEMGHYLAVKLCSGSVYDISIGFCGAAMRAELPCAKAELISAISGPVCGALLILLGKWFPRLAVCAFVQTAYNVLPISGLDGWRVLRCVVKKLFLPSMSEKIMSAVEYTALFCIFVLSVYISIRFRWAIVIVIGAIIMAVKVVLIKIPCKQR